MEENENTDETIRLEIIHTKPSSFYLQDLETLEEKITPEKLTNKDLGFSLEIETSTNVEDELIKVTITLDVRLIKGDINIFGIKSDTIFRTEDFDKVVDKDHNSLKKSKKDFTKKIFNICIGGIRGMLATKLTVTDFNHITLPLFDLKEV